MNRREYIQQTTRFLGYTMLTGAVMDLLVSCEENSVQPFKPIFFNEAEGKTLAAITDTICPKTKTPGANEIGVPQFIDSLVHQLLKKEDQVFFKNGIANINQLANKSFNKSFDICDTQQRTTILLELEKSSAPTPMTQWGKPMEAHPIPLSFYRKIKSLTLMAYFTSKKIGKEYLAYDPIPGPFQACIPYHNQPNWTES